MPHFRKSKNTSKDPYDRDVFMKSSYTSRTKVALLEFFKITNPFPIESYMLQVVHVSEILRSNFHTYKPFNIIYLKGCGGSQMWSVNDGMCNEPNTLRSINFIPFEVYVYDCLYMCLDKTIQQPLLTYLRISGWVDKWKSTLELPGVWNSLQRALKAKFQRLKSFKCF